MKHKSYPKTLLSLLGICGILSGCATYNKSAPYPADAPQAKTEITDEHPSWMSSFPPGIYYNEDARMVFSGHQRGEQVGSMFGLVGVLVTDQINRSSGEKRFGAEAKEVQLDLVEQTRSIFEQAAAEHPCSKILLDPSEKTKSTLTISPYVLMDYDGTCVIHPFLALEVELKNSKGALWSVHYFAQAPQNFNEVSWGKGEDLPIAIKTAIHRACTALVMDINGELTGTRKVETYSGLAWCNEQYSPIMKFRGVIVGETEDCYILRMAIPDMSVAAGIQIIQKDSITLSDADFDLPWESKKS
ncbi:MAG: hypothetical protein JW942_01040 [Opitutales bacterium]|nr:hypothetical protein [Opitutales bacterium]